MEHERTRGGIAATLLPSPSERKKLVESTYPAQILNSASQRL